ncbi:MAG: nucleotide exchange factor GrpE [Acidobacteria bacterium]|nr:nucleotide exchange factor GrpE [Acidobacteriota bacterium]
MAQEKPHFRIVDRRIPIDDGDATPAPREPQYPSYVEELKARAELAEQKLKEKISRLDEEYNSFRSRLAREMERRFDQEKLSFLREFLEVLDNLQRAMTVDSGASESTRLQGLQEGVQLNYELFLSKLKSVGMKPIEVLNRPFDPREAEAVSVIPVSDPGLDQYVLEVVQPGFRYGEQLLRPARVRVGTYQSAPTTAEDT